MKISHIFLTSCQYTGITQDLLKKHNWQASYTDNSGILTQGGRRLEGDAGGAQVVVVFAVPVPLLEVGPPQVGADRWLTVWLGLALVAQEGVGVLHSGGVDGHLIRVSDRDVVAVRLL